MIPKKIHYCWLSGDEMPELIQNCINSWRKCMPDYELVLWDCLKIDIENIPWVKEAFQSKKYAFAADYIRLYALYTEGGIYLDSDVQVVKKFDDLLRNNSFIGLETGGDFEPAIMGAHSGCEWIGKCLEYYEGRHFIKSDGSLDVCPLPTIVGRIFSQYYNIKLPLRQVVFYAIPSITIYTSDFFSPKSLHSQRIECTDNTYAIHHFDGAWLVKDWKFKMKNRMHRCLIILFGQRIHNYIINIIRKR